MKYSRSSVAMVTLLASTSSGVRARCATAIFMIMCVKPGPSVPEHAVTSPVTRENPSPPPECRATVAALFCCPGNYTVINAIAATVARHSGGGDGVDDGVVSGTAKQRRELLVLAQF